MTSEETMLKIAEEAYKQGWDDRNDLYVERTLKSNSNICKSFMKFFIDTIKSKN